jgi:choline dehydrogenase-like flavoprotein
MFVDARSIPEGTVIESDLCIIGAGAAGIALAREFFSAGLRVSLLESGGLEFEEDTQELYDGKSIGRPFTTLTTSRAREFGGTTNFWGGWSLPLDPIDFEPREGLPYRGWPIRRTDLDPWYAQAHEVVQIGPYEYRPEKWGIRLDEIPAPFNGPNLVCRMLQCSPPTRFAAVYGSALKQASAVTVFLHANALRLIDDEAGRTVSELAVATLGGNRFSIRSKVFVLAAGGIETARLLLASGKPEGPGLGNGNGLVGRFFMVHLEYGASTVAVADPYTDFRFCTNELLNSSGLYYAPFGLKFVTFVAVAEDRMRALKLPNCKYRWTYTYEPEMSGINALRRLLSRSSNDMTDDVLEVARHIGGAGEFAFRKAMGWPLFPVRAINVHMTSEPLPNQESRIMLGDDRDALGMRRVVVDWRLTAEDKRAALAMQRLLGTEVGRTGLGRLRLEMTEDDTTWPDDLFGDQHHMGTTRMDADPGKGVVNADCRVHGLSNLYVASSSVYPTAGAANPTLTIVALALRLADHIKKKQA